LPVCSGAAQLGNYLKIRADRHPGESRGQESPKHLDSRLKLAGMTDWSRRGSAKLPTVMEKSLRSAVKTLRKYRTLLCPQPPPNYRIVPNQDSVPDWDARGCNSNS